MHKTKKIGIYQLIPLLKNPFSILILMIFLVFSTYSGYDHHTILAWDDTSYIKNNDWVTDPSWTHIHELFTQFRVSNWHPVTWLSFIPDYQRCGERAWCYKQTNIFIHALNSFLVFLLSYKLTTTHIKLNNHKTNINPFWISLFSSTLFAVHTQHTESVIWIAERKDLICALFYLSSILSYLNYKETKNKAYFNLTIVLFFLSILAKPMAITLPFILVLIDYFPLKIIKPTLNIHTFHSIKEKLLLFTISTSTMLITILSQKVDRITQPDFLVSITTATISLTHHIGSFLFPFNLSPFYPYEILHEIKEIYLSFSAILTLTLIILIKRYGKIIIIGVVCYFILSLPTLGLVKVGAHAFADRYAYLPTISFYIMLAMFFAKQITISLTAKFVSIITFTAIVIIQSINTNEYLNTWENDITLWTHSTKKHNGYSTLAHLNLASAFHKAGHYQKAIEQDMIAINISPDKFYLYISLYSSRLALKDIGFALSAVNLLTTNIPNNYIASLAAATSYLNISRTERDPSKKIQILSKARDQYITSLNIYLRNKKNIHNDPKTLFHLAIKLMEFDQHDEAIDALNQLSENTEWRKISLLKIADNLIHRDKENASQYINILIQEYPDDPSTKQLFRHIEPH